MQKNSPDEYRIKGSAIPIINLNSFFAEFKQDEGELSDEQFQYVLLTRQYLELVKEGKEIIDISTKGVIRVKPITVEAFFSFYDAFMLSKLSEIYSVDEFLDKFDRTINVLQSTKDISRISPRDIHEIHYLFVSLSRLLSNINW